MKPSSMICRLAAIGLAATAFAGNASAALVTYTGADHSIATVANLLNSSAAAAAFDAATGPMSILTFESGVPAGVSITGGGSITNNSSCGALCGINVTPSGENFLMLFATTATFTFTSPINAFGMYVTGLQTEIVQQETITFTDGSSQVINVPWSINGGGAFVGFTDIGKSILSVTYNSTSDYVAIDDVRYGVTAVPEPSTYAMLLLGLGLAGLVARRQKR